MKICSLCQHDNPSDAAFCGMCGHELPVVPPAEAVVKAVHAALEEIVTQSVSGGFGPPGFKDSNSLHVWRKLNSSHGERAISPLCDVLQAPQVKWETRWKALKLLDYFLRTAVGRSRAQEILRQIADRVLDGGHVQRLALETIRQAPVPPEEKWGLLFEIVQVAQPREAAVLARSLADFTPVAERERTGNLLVDLLTYAPPDHGISNFTDALKTLQSFHVTPRLREIVRSSSDDSTVNYVCGLLGEWGDRESAPVVREAIDRLNHGNSSYLANLARHLYALEGAECAPYLADVLLAAAPKQQGDLIRALQRDFKDTKKSPFVDAVRQVLRSTSDPELTKRAEAFMTAVEG